jgi:hypothetical protein
VLIEFTNTKHSLISSLFKALTGADEFDIALSAGIAPPAADEADNACGGYGAIV